MILTQEQLELKEMVRDFAEKEIRPIAAEYDVRGEFPMELYKKVFRVRESSNISQFYLG